MKIQAMGWLAAGVLAAGLNSTYHNGGLQWAHNIVDRVELRTNVVLALATGRVERLVANDDSMNGFNLAASDDSSPSDQEWTNDETPSSECPLKIAAHLQTTVDRTQSEFDRFQAMTARQQARLARFEANRARIEARIARIRIPAIAVNPVVVSVPRIEACPRVHLHVPQVHVNVPRIPAIRLPPVPPVHVDLSDAGPV